MFEIKDQHLFRKSASTYFARIGLNPMLKFGYGENRDQVPDFRRGEPGGSRLLSKTFWPRAPEYSP
jgi:hypothetical protein